MWRWLRTRTGILVTIVGTLVTAVIVNVAVRAVSGDVDPPSPPPMAAWRNLIESLGTPDPNVQVRVGRELADVETVVGSGYRAAVDVGDTVRLPALLDTGRLVTAYTDDGSIAGAAAQVPLSTPGDTSDLVEVNYTSTALARLVTVPPLLTSNPLEIALIAGAADRSRNLEVLAQRMRQHAEDDPGSFWTTPTDEEAAAFADLVVDVLATLQEEAGQLPGRPTGQPAAEPTAFIASDSPLASAALTRGADQPFAAVTAPAFPTAGFPVAPAAADVVFHACDRAFDVDSRSPVTASGTCLYPHPQPDGMWEIDVINHGPSWAFMWGAAPGSIPIPIAASQPLRYQVPTLHSLAVALAKDAARTTGQGAVKLFCGGVGLVPFMDVSCPEQWTQQDIDLFREIASKFDDFAKAGETAFHVDAATAQGPLYAVTAGDLRGFAVLPPEVDSSIGAFKVLAWVFTLLTHVAQPALEMALGFRPAGKHRGDPSNGSELFTAAVEAIKELDGSGELTRALNDARALDPTVFVPALLRLIRTFLTSGPIMDAFLASAIGVPTLSTAVDTVVKAVVDEVAKLVIGPVWVKALWKADETVAQAATAALGVYQASTRLSQIADREMWAALAPPSPPEESPSPSVTVLDELRGGWSGTVDQPATGQYQTHLELREVGDRLEGPVLYPSLRCSGYVSETSRTDQAVTFEETILRNVENRCITPVQFTVTPANGQLHVDYHGHDSGGSQASAILSRVEGATTPSRGTWIGPVDQSTSDEAYDARLMLREQEGALSGLIEYESLACGGSVEEVARAAGVVVLSEDLFWGEGECVDGGDIVVTMSGSTVRWYWIAGELDATAALQPYPEIAPQGVVDSVNAFLAAWWRGDAEATSAFLASAASVEKSLPSPDDSVFIGWDNVDDDDCSHLETGQYKCPLLFFTAGSGLLVYAYLSAPGEQDGLYSIERFEYFGGLQ